MAFVTYVFSMGNFDVLVIHQPLLEMMHIALTGSGTVACVEGCFGDQVAGIDSGGEGPKSQNRPLHLLSEHAAMAVPRGVFLSHLPNFISS